MQRTPEEIADNVRVLESYFDRAEFQCYSDVAKWFSTARSKDKGKPFGRWARVFKIDNGNFSFMVHGKTELLIVTPNDKLVITATSEQIRRIGNTVTANLHRAFPIMLNRAAKLRYKVQSIGNARTQVQSGNCRVWEAFKTGPETFVGLVLDLNRGVFENAKADRTDRINKDKRVEWLRALRTFKRGIKVRAKLGVFDKYISERGFTHTLVNWSISPNIDNLYNAITLNTYDEDLLKLFVSNTPRWGAIKPQYVVENVESILNDNSVLLRDKFGVFEEEA